MTGEVDALRRHPKLTPHTHGDEPVVRPARLNDSCCIIGNDLSQLFILNLKFNCKLNPLYPDELGERCLCVDDHLKSNLLMFVKERILPVGTPTITQTH